MIDYEIFVECCFDDMSIEDIDDEITEFKSDIYNDAREMIANLLQKRNAILEEIKSAEFLDRLVDFCRTGK